MATSGDHHLATSGDFFMATDSIESAEQELARLRAQVKDLQAEKTRLATERDILRSAAKYFAGETNW